MDIFHGAIASQMAANKGGHLKQSSCLQLPTVSKAFLQVSPEIQDGFCQWSIGNVNWTLLSRWNRSALLWRRRHLPGSSLVSHALWEHTPMSAFTMIAHVCDLWKSPWKQWNKSLSCNLEFIAALHRKKIRYRTAKPLVLRNLDRLCLTWKS